MVQMARKLEEKRWDLMSGGVAGSLPFCHHVESSTINHTITNLACSEHTVYQIYEKQLQVAKTVRMLVLKKETATWRTGWVQ